ncbi:MAG: general secretion pathway protein GspK [Lentisphaerae bacterium]|nr:general secretion pathway protein GspK [Lentisphaerota bacterium]
MSLNQFNNKSKKGSALVVVLWVTGILSLFVMSFAFTMHVETRITSAWRKKLKAEYLAQSGIELARMALVETSDPDLDIDDTLVYVSKGGDENLRYAIISLAQGGSATLTRQVGSNTVTVAITPENARMDISGMIFVDDRELTYDAWENLFKSVDVPLADRDTLIDCLLDWVDENDFTRLNGAESSYYESLDPPYSAKNAAIDTVDEIALIKGFDEKIRGSEKTIYEAIAPNLTCYGVADRININAADAGTLVAFLNIDQAIAEEIVRERMGSDELESTEDDEPFRDINDLLTRIPSLDSTIDSLITFSGTGLYKIKSTGKVGNLTHTITCVASWQNQEFLFLTWSEGPEESPDPIVEDEFGDSFLDNN